MVVKPKSYMGEYIAVHSLVPKNELPERMRNIPDNTIYIRDNIVSDRKKRTLKHEHREIKLMEKGLTYKDAHKKAGY